jgi:hypothetical protein
MVNISTRKRSSSELLTGVSTAQHKYLEGSVPVHSRLTIACMKPLLDALQSLPSVRSSVHQVLLVVARVPLTLALSACAVWHVQRFHAAA